jgi:hypothetical protein
VRAGEKGHEVATEHDGLSQMQMVQCDIYQHTTATESSSLLAAVNGPLPNLVPGVEPIDRRNGRTRGALPQARVQRVWPLAGEQQPEEPTMRKIFGVVVFATALIGSASVAPAQSSRDLTEPTGTEANRIKTQTGGYYGRGHGAYAYSSGLHRRWHWSHQRW